MKKSFLLLPLSALVLSACSSNTHTPAPVVDSGELSPGIMQPVDGSGATSYGWQSDIQSVEMPASMTSAPITPLPTPLPATVPQPMPQPVYTAPQAVQTAQQSVTNVQNTVKNASQDFAIPRDENNAPIYSQIQKGFYGGDTYTVRKGDTMFLIAYIAGKDVAEIAALNNMTEPYQLSVGQVLKLGNGTAVARQSVSTPVTKPVEPVITYTQGANGTVHSSDGNVSGPVKAGVGGVVASAGISATPAPVVNNAPKPTAPAVTATTANVAPISSGINWVWPTSGKVVQGFSSAEGGNKGLDISGTKGQAVKAAAAGKVVYAGNGLQGYGNLIIIKHNDDFLSAYAHNDSISVKEQQSVKSGQTIAKMGNTGTNSTKLHFEIRYKGKSVDPAGYLPKR